MLVGTISVEKSESALQDSREDGRAAEVLNAKNHEREA